MTPDAMRNAISLGVFIAHFTVINNVYLLAYRCPHIRLIIREISRTPVGYFVLNT